MLQTTRSPKRLVRNTRSRLTSKRRPNITVTRGIVAIGAALGALMIIRELPAIRRYVRLKRM